MLNSLFIKGTWDAEPDLFYLNVAGLSGKFYLSKADANDVMTGTLLSAEKMTIRYYGAAYTGPQGPRSWEVKTAGGITYQFKTIEYTYIKTSGAPVGSVNEADSRCTQCIETERALQEYQTMLSDERKQATAWYVSKIVSATGAEIGFEYDNDNYATRGQPQRSQEEIEYHEIYETGPIDSYLSFFGLFKVPASSCVQSLLPLDAAIKWNTSQTITNDRVLKRITFGQGTVTFMTEPRLDMEKETCPPAFTAQLPQRLKQIVIRHPGSELTKTFDLYQGYFNQGQSAAYLRSRLDSVVENNESRHRFTYDTRAFLPSKQSFAKDHWGYYNGQTSNTTLVPLQQFRRADPGASRSTTYTAGDVTYVHNGIGDMANGANRRSDPGQGPTGAPQDYIYLKAGVLTQIRYPTGGTTQFDYEPNTYYDYYAEYDSDVDFQNISLTNGYGSANSSLPIQAFRESDVFEIKRPVAAQVKRVLDCGDRSNGSSPCGPLVDKLRNDKGSAWSNYAGLVLETENIDIGGSTKSNIIYDLSTDVFTQPDNVKQKTSIANTDNFTVFLYPGRYKLMIRDALRDSVYRMRTTISITFPNNSALSTNATSTDYTYSISNVVQQQAGEFASSEVFEIKRPVTFSLTRQLYCGDPTNPSSCQNWLVTNPLSDQEYSGAKRTSP